MVTLRRYIIILSLVASALPTAASANLLQSTHFRLDPNAGSTFGGTGTSASYRLQASGGEASVGAGSSQSYKLTQGYIAHLQNSLQLTVLPSGIFSYYPLDTGAGNQIYDVSTNANQAQAVGGSNWVAGQVGQALTLNGSTQYVASSVAQTNPNPLTLELWFKTTTTAGGTLAGFSDVQTGAGTTSDRNLYLTSTGQLVFGVYTTAYKTISSTSAYNDGLWHHVAASLGARGLVLVVDGTLVATDATTTAGANMTGYWRFGYGNLTAWPSAPTSNFLSGTIDELHVYTSQLPDQQVNGDYLAGKNHLRFAHVLPALTSGTSSSYGVDAFIQTDAPGYDLDLQATSLLTHSNGITTIPMMSGTVGAPLAWTEGVTKGLGFTVTGGTQVEAKWGTSPNYAYAGVPLSSTVYHSRTGWNGGVAEKTSLQYRVDTSAAQLSGSYSTNVVYTATIKP